MRAIGTSLALALVLGGCASERESSGAAAGASPKQVTNIAATRVETAVITVSQPNLEMIRPGEVEGARTANLASALGGFVEAVKVSSGDEVKAGQVIAYVDTSTHNAQAKLTRVEVDESKRELARLEKLGRSVASARVDAARARVKLAEAQHALSRTRQGRAVIRAPFAGSIVDLNAERGEVVAPGAPIARLIQLDPVHVTVSVADRDLVNVRPGTTAQVTTVGAPQPLAGVVRRLQPAANLMTRTFIVEVEVANPERKLLAGMMAQVAFRNDERGEAVLLPQDVLVTRRDGNGVFVIGADDKAMWRPLTLGAIIGTQVEVMAGLQVGERVVTQGQRSLTKGDALLVTREGTCCTDGRITYHKTVSDKPPPRAEVQAPADSDSGSAAAATPNRERHK